MVVWTKPIRRSLKAVASNKGRGKRTLRSTLPTALALVMGLAGAENRAYASVQPYVIDNDRGGTVRDRLREIDTLRTTGQPVEIRGQICYSTCTMLLGLPQTCVSPGTVFGFHGPSRSGKRLKPEEFEYYSQLIAEHYPETLRNWYMKKGRKRIRGIYRMSGTEIIRMGVKAC
ncbi:hypothetical protein [Parasedimentitalea maritima]|uniref:hypothetical protein n=1 Tax=Parasedimentitalea maritima TaxID=2578117 RepID=UPI00131AA4B9|nr:hypothetical protein [Zongyanglinia marina]